MRNFLTNCKTAKEYLFSNIVQDHMEHDKLEKDKVIELEIQRLGKSTISYLTKLSQIDISKKNANLVAMYRELNRIKLSLYLKTPVMYQEVFDLKPTAFFDTIYSYDSNRVIHEESLENLEYIYLNSDNNDIISNTGICSGVTRDIKKLQNFISLINSYSD